MSTLKLLTRKAILFIGLFLMGISLWAQTYVTNGTAVDLGGDRFRLTQALNSQAGSVWFQNQLDLNFDFSIDVSLYFGTNNGGADGIAFVLQPVCNGIGGIGGGIGYQGISPSFAVEYDTWQNGNLQDPTADHMAIQQNGNLTHTAPSMLAGVHNLPNIENGVNHSSLLTWTAATKTFQVSFDGNLIFTYSADIVSTIFGNNSKVFWGFTAATGAANNLQIVEMENVSFTATTPFTVTDASCPNTADGAIDMMIVGGAGPHTYLWSDGSTAEDRSGLAAGNYSVSVTDANGCVSSYAMAVGATPDVLPPAIACSADLVVDNDAGLCGAVVLYSPATFTDGCPLAPLSIPGYSNLGSLGSSTYFLSNASTNAVNAGNQATALGGHLVVISSAAENSFVATAAGGRAWIGLDDVDSEGKFNWVTGEAVSYSNWANNEPNNDLGIEDYVEINRFGPGLWNDLPVNIGLRYIVEFDGVALHTAGLGSGCFFSVGTHVVSYTATDAAGNTSDCSFNITVNDTEAPDCQSKDITINLDDTGNATISTMMINNGSTDNCQILGMALDRTDFDCTDAYDYLINGNTRTVTLTVTDIYNNASDCMAEVTVLYSGDDADCDGVGDECDVCMNGDDAVDNNNDGMPDCAYYPGPTDLDADWYCSKNNKKVKIYVCHRPPGNPANFHTICISENAVQTHINHGDWVGPCVSCEGTMKKANVANEIYNSLSIAPNPTNDYINIHFDTESDSEIQLSISNFLGEMIYTQSNISPLTMHDYKINITEQFIPGVYLITIEQDNNRSTTRVMIAK